MWHILLLKRGKHDLRWEQRMKMWSILLVYLLHVFQLTKVFIGCLQKVLKSLCIKLWEQENVLLVPTFHNRVYEVNNQLCSVIQLKYQCGLLTKSQFVINFNPFVMDHLTACTPF